jgi:transcriptional regulator with XRE-family HTH domain
MPTKPSVQSPSDAQARGAEPDLGHLLRSARTHRRLTLRDVEAATGIPNPHLSQIERGIIRRPDQQIVWKLSRLYHLDFALVWQWMDGGSEQKNTQFAVALNLLNDLSDVDLKRATEYLERLNRREGTR